MRAVSMIAAICLASVASAAPMWQDNTGLRMDDRQSPEQLINQAFHSPPADWRPLDEGQLHNIEVERLRKVAGDRKIVDRLSISEVSPTGGM